MLNKFVFLIHLQGKQISTFKNKFYFFKCKLSLINFRTHKKGCKRKKMPGTNSSNRKRSWNKKVLVSRRTSKIWNCPCKRWAQLFFFIKIINKFVDWKVKFYIKTFRPIKTRLAKNIKSEISMMRSPTKTNLSISSTRKRKSKVSTTKRLQKNFRPLKIK